MSNTCEESNHGLVLRFKLSYGLSKQTARQYGIAAKAFVDYLENTERCIDDISSDLFNEYMADGSKRLAEATLRTYLVATRAFIYWLADEGLVGRQVANEVRAVHYRPNKRDEEPGTIEPELIERFVLSCGDIAAYTKRSYASKVRIFSRYLLDHHLTLEMTDEETIAMFAIWATENLTRNSASAVLSSVKRFYRWLEQEGLFEDMAKNIAAIKRDADKRLIKPLTPESAKLVIAAAEDHPNPLKGLRDRILVELMLACAMMPGEFAVLDVKNVMFVEGHAIISVPARSNRFESLVYVPTGTAGLLKRYLMIRQPEPDDPLFVSVLSRADEKGRRLAHSSFNHLIIDIFEKAGVEGCATSSRIVRTSLEIAISLGANERELTRFGRYRSKAPSINIADSKRREGARIEDKIEEVMASAKPGSKVKVTSVGCVRRMLEDLSDGDLVAVAISEGKPLEIKPIEQFKNK